MSSKETSLQTAAREEIARRKVNRSRDTREKIAAQHPMLVRFSSEELNALAAGTTLNALFGFESS